MNEIKGLGVPIRPQVTGESARREALDFEQDALGILKQIGQTLQE